MRKNCCINIELKKLLVVDKNYRCVGLITVKDIEKAEKFIGIKRQTWEANCRGSNWGR